MALQNIGAKNRDDAFYRYKMPRMVTKIEGRGNGIKTNVVNMVDIAKALARPAAYTTKYFGCELGAQSKFDEKNGTSLVNGAHETAKLAGLLENFIKKYVLCYGCGNPETEITITKTQMITLKCAACGFVSDVDMRDKLTTFIIKNPPEQKKGGKDKKAMRRAEKERAKEGERADEEMKKLRKEAAKRKGSVSTKKKADEDQCSPGGSQVEKNKTEREDIQWQTDTSAEAARQRIQEQLSAVTAEMVVLSAADADEENVKSGKKDCVEEKDEKSPPFQDAFDGIFGRIFEGVHKGFSKHVARKKNELVEAVAATEDGNGGMLLLHAMESYSLKSGSEVLKEVALVLKALYDEDVIGEEMILDWYKEGLDGDNRNSEIWKKAKPFVEWLQSAESESEEE